MSDSKSTSTVKAQSGWGVSHMRLLLRQNSYTVATILLVALFILYPYLEKRPNGEVGLDALSTLLVGQLISRIRKSHILSRPAVLLFFVVFPMVWLDSYYENRFILSVEHTFLGALFFLASLATMLDLFRRQEVSMSHLAGCLTAYLLLGYTFASTYYLVYAIAPGAFALTPGSAFHFSDALGFSFMNLTANFLGGASANGHITRSLGVLEAMGGQLYLSIFVGQIVGAYMNYRSRHFSDGDTAS